MEVVEKPEEVEIVLEVNDGEVDHRKERVDGVFAWFVCTVMILFVVTIVNGVVFDVRCGDVIDDGPTRACKTHLYVVFVSLTISFVYCFGGFAIFSCFEDYVMTNS